MKIKIHNILFLFGGIFFVSCKTIYRPNLAQMHVFKEKNSGQADVMIGSNGGEVQVGYAFTKNWAIVAAGVYDVSKATVMDSLYGVRDGNSDYSNLSVELGLNYYKWLREDSIVCLSLIGGGGYGKTKGYSDIWYNPDFVYYDASYYKIFWQPTVSFSKDYVNFSIATRFRFLSFTSLTNERADIIRTGVDTYIEPVAALKVGGEQFKLHLQLGTSIPIQKQNDYTASKLLFSAGFHLNFKKQEKTDYYFE